MSRKTRDSEAPGLGRLSARPARAGGVATPGLHRLDLDGSRDGLYYVPAGYRPDLPAPMVLMLHGAGGNAQFGISPLMQHADSAGLILLAPESRRQTWDSLLGSHGPDIAFIDRALAQLFARCTIDPERLAIEGFSDGASYALSVGITNGDLFTHVMAFSKGFKAPAGRHGAPHVFISHGVHDVVLPIDPCSRRIVPQLRRAGYDVVYREFDGPHTVPTAIVDEALTWFTSSTNG